MLGCLGFDDDVTWLGEADDVDVEVVPGCIGVDVGAIVVFGPADHLAVDSRCDPFC